jgi:hypothetical protein
VELVGDFAGIDEGLDEHIVRIDAHTMTQESVQFARGQACVAL